MPVVRPIGFFLIALRASFAAPPAELASDAIPTDPAKYPYNHVACIAELPDGDLLVVWVAGSKEAAKDTVIVAARRKKDETSWSAPIIIADHPGAGVANPTMFVDDRKVARLFYAELLNEGKLCPARIVTRTSEDGGRTWSPSRPALDAMCTLVKNKPIILRDGRWLLPAYQEAIYQSQFWISEDRGRHWKATTPLLTLPNNNLQPAVVGLSDGTLFALMRNGAGSGFTWEGRSNDGGKSWAMKERRDLPNPGSGIDMIRLTDGRLLMVFNPSTKERTPLSVSVSSDNGHSWSPPRTIESGPPQLSYPSIIQASDGRIHLVYSHCLAHIQHVEFDPSWLKHE